MNKSFASLGATPAPPCRPRARLRMIAGRFAGRQTDRELEALFYQYGAMLTHHATQLTPTAQLNTRDGTLTRTDRDSDGEIDKDELAEALFRAGYRIERERFDDLFVKFDTDGSASGESRVSSTRVLYAARRSQ